MKNDFFAFAQNKYIYIPFILWFGIQLFKLIWDLATTKKFNFKRLIMLSTVLTGKRFV